MFEKNWLVRHGYVWFSCSCHVCVARFVYFLDAAAIRVHVAGSSGTASSSDDDDAGKDREKRRGGDGGLDPFRARPPAGRAGGLGVLS